MKVKEIIEARQQPVAVPPTIMKRQGRVGQVVAKIAASDQQQPATEMEKVLAMRRYSDLKKQTDKNYAARLRQQLANAEAGLRTGK
jgi:hypothetical protein